MVIHCSVSNDFFWATTKYDYVTTICKIIIWCTHTVNLTKSKQYQIGSTCPSTVSCAELVK